VQFILEEGVVPFVLPDEAFGHLANADAVNVWFGLVWFGLVNLLPV